MTKWKYHDFRPFFESRFQEGLRFSLYLFIFSYAWNGLKIWHAGPRKVIMISLELPFRGISFCQLCSTKKKNANFHQVIKKSNVLKFCQMTALEYSMAIIFQSFRENTFLWDYLVLYISGINSTANLLHFDPCSLMFNCKSISSIGSKRNKCF